MGISISIEKSGLVRIEKLLNGVIAGLVGITAGCAFVEPVGAIWIGVISGFVLYGAEWFVLRFLKVDDPVGAISAHGFVGVWGTLAVALFAPLDLLPLNNMVDQLLVQLIGVTAVFFWTFSVGVIVFLVLKQMGVLRVSAKEELKGLNIVEHGAKSIWLDTMRSIQTVVNTGNLQKSVFVEPETESGEIAKSFNHLLGQLNHTFDNIRETMNDAMDGKERSVPVDGEVNSDLEQAKLWINQSTTKLVKLNKTLRNDALHDSLTGLPNRALLMDRLRIKIKQSNRERHPFALLFIDLDGFKQINDQLGHKQGDQLLINVANHLTESVRESDTVARLGGDEFVVILGGWKQLAELQDTIDRILQHLNQSFQGKEEDLLVSGSIGVSIYPDHGESEEQLIHNADQAMYQAKQAGKGCCRFYNYSAHL
jgi:Amt family ammonium transporter